MCNARNFYFLEAWLLCSLFVTLCKVLGSWLWGCAGAEQALWVCSYPALHCHAQAVTQCPSQIHRWAHIARFFLTVLRPVPHTPGTLYYYHLCFITTSFAKPFGTTVTITVFQAWNHINLYLCFISPFSWGSYFCCRLISWQTIENNTKQWRSKWVSLSSLDFKGNTFGFCY